MKLSLACLASAACSWDPKQRCPQRGEFKVHDFAAWSFAIVLEAMFDEDSQSSSVVRLKRLLRPRPIHRKALTEEASVGS
jgi:hypothetical protein